MQTLQKQISLFGEEKSTSLVVDFPANLTAKPVKDWGKQTSDISGRKCLEQLKRFNQLTLWAKMFMELLIGTEEWSSTKCKLTWKIKGTKSSRLYFQLQASTLPTKEIEHSLLPTVRTVMPLSKNRIVEGNIEIRESDGKRCGASLETLAYKGLLPTATASDATVGAVIGKNDTFKVSKNGKVRRYIQTGQNMSLNLARSAKLNMLPTPTASGEEGYQIRAKRQGHNKAISFLEAHVEFKLMPTPNASEGHKITGKENQNSLTKMAREQTGETSQLNPQFVAEMMSFPPDYTILPFLSGDEKASKLTETQ